MHLGYRTVALALTISILPSAPLRSVPPEVERQIAYQRPDLIPYSQEEIGVRIDLTAPLPELRRGIRVLSEVSERTALPAREGETLRHVILRFYRESRSFWIKAKKIARTVEEVVSTDNQTLLLMRGGSLDPGAVKLREGDLVFLPELPEVADTFTVAAITDTTREKLAEAWVGELNSADRRGIKRLNSGPVGYVTAYGSYFGADLDEPVKAGEEVVLPRMEATVRLAVRSGVSPATARERVARVLDSQLSPRAELVDGEELDTMKCVEFVKEQTGDPDKRNWYLEAIGADRIYPSDLRGLKKVKLAVLDSGLDLAHPEFDRILLDKRYSIVTQDDIEAVEDEHEHGHGTAVSGVATGRLLLSDPALPALEEVLEIPQLRVIRIATKKADTSIGRLNFFGLPAAIAFARPSRVMNMSFRYETPETNYLLRSAFSNNDQVLFVTAAGNDTRDLDLQKVYPASLKVPNLIAVAALDEKGQLYKTSNYGDKTVEIAAPGRAIWTTVPMSQHDGYWCLSGTSLAAPLVSLTAGLLFARDDDFIGEEVRRRLMASCDWRPKLATCANGAKCVQRGCVLNIGRALSLSKDLVELRANGDEQSRIVRGRIESQVELRSEDTDCGNVVATPANGEILRISLPADGPVRWMHQNGDGCEGQILTDEIRLRTDETCPGTLASNRQCRVETSRIAEILFRDPAYCGRNDCDP